MQLIVREIVIASYVTVVLFSDKLIALLFINLSLCWAQAPGDEHVRCTEEHSSPPTYPDTERNLMDSYNYEQLLPGNGTGDDPIPNAVWNDYSFDDNDITPEEDKATYVSIRGVTRIKYSRRQEH